MRKIPVLLMVLLVSMLLLISFQVIAGAEESPPEVGIDNLDQSIGDVVTVKGTITWVNGNEFLLEDSIIIDCGPPWFHTIEIEDGVEVTVTGQVGYAGPPWAETDQLEIDACVIIQGDKTIEIRGCDFDEPPAWAGGPFRHFNAGPPWKQDGDDAGPPWTRNDNGAGPPWTRNGGNAGPPWLRQ